MNKRARKYGLILMIILSILVTFLFEFRSISAVSDLPLIIGAHRGNSVDYTENTLEAFNGAMEDPKYKFIEFDIQYTKDKEIVVFHENNMFRIPKKFVDIPSLTYDELNNKFDFEIPRYEQVMELLAGNKPLNIEIKSYGDLIQDKKLVDFIIEDLKERGILNKIMISSISKEIVEYISQNYPELKTGKIYWVQPITYIHSRELVRSFYAEMKSIGADYIMLHGLNLKNYELLVELKPKDMQLVFWYFNDKIFILQKDPSDGLW